MKSVEIILAPYHGGVREDRVGAGPIRLMEMGLADDLKRVGVETSLSDLGHIPECDGEVGRAFEVKRRVAHAVSEAVRTGRFPLVLSGNCNVEVGTYAGLGSPDVPLIWFDGHTDFYTPEDIEHGYFDSMGAATLTGQCWRRFAMTVPGFSPLEPHRLLYCGSRNLEGGLLHRLSAAAVSMVQGGRHRPQSFADALNSLLPIDTDAVLIHLDMDCIDTSEGMANEYAETGGLSGNDLLACLDRILARCNVLGLTVA
ncbi:arginase family protein [Aestuariibius sp. 2305UL40-4]|uniref:arginase family protein n=1 Tax=Aestuariibius violaceus TaxID=3234132 RepID=UPI00345EBF3B